MPNPAHPYYSILEICDQYHATLAAVTKTRSKEDVLGLYHMGQRLFAENRAHELVEKAQVLPADIEWHLIGHLQTNKVRAIIHQVRCIQSLDSAHLWEKIQEEGAKANLKVNCLLQIKIAEEATKYGWLFQELEQALKSGIHHSNPNVKVEGVMGMASLTPDMQQVRNEMKQLKTYFDILKDTYFKSEPEFKIISMGMSGDYRIALEEGSTMIRIGSILFP